ncbi:response regulator [Dyella halodurans]|uniref:histidine kinase n=1 Tax=Dyella halodurans TaxID=1920171 RepID=A0ABV9BXE8_9GAMM|nr:ATP-binding protein [Dyella halodurans]
MQAKSVFTLLATSSLGLVFPWSDNQATALSPMALTLALLLMFTATLAFALAWLLQMKNRKTKYLQDQLLAQRSLCQEALNALPLPIALHGMNGQPAIVNASGRSVPGALEAIMAVIGGADFAAKKPALLQGQTSQHALEYTGADGDVHPAHAWIRTIFDQHGQVQGYASSLLDITAFRDAEREAKASERSLDELARRIPVVVLTLLLDAGNARHLTFATGNMKALFNADLRDLKDTDGSLRTAALRDCIHPEDWSAFEQLIAPATTDPQTRDLDFRTFGQHGLRWIHATLAPTQQADGTSRLMGYFIDTTELNLRNEALRVARDVAERASKAKGDFLAIMSHEIRTPMNGLIGMLELFGHTPINQEQRELLQAVGDSAGNLLQILNDILDFSKLEAGDVRLDLTAFDPRLWMDHVAGVMTAAAHKKGLDIHFSTDASVAGQLRGDGLRLGQVLLNLLSNAIKFTDRGGVSARLVALGDSGSHQRLCLSVSDTGIGIESDKQAALFKPFAQAEAWTSRRYGGTGLGLAICHHLVQLMEGSIELISEVDAGTTVNVEVRLPVGERAIEAPGALHGRHAVVRLESTETTATLGAYLHAAGMTVEQVDPSQPMREGMAASLLFVDVTDVVSQTQINAHVVAVTTQPLVPAGMQWKDERILLSANPLKWQSTLRASMAALELDDPAGRRSLQDDSGGTQPLAVMPFVQSTDAGLPVHHGHILVAEDHPISQQLIRRQLGLLGLSCDVVDNGRDAYEALTGGDYALLLTDCNMPQMSGYELARAWRAHEDTTGAPHRLPLIAMTANALSGQTARAREAGMSDVLSKPLQLLALSQKLAQWLPGPTPLRASADAPTGSRGVKDTATQAELEQLFTTTSLGDLQDLRACLAAADAPAATQVLHRLLGALPLFADGDLLEQGRQLFEALQAEGGKQALPGLNGFMQRTEELLSTLNRSRLIL